METLKTHTTVSDGNSRLKLPQSKELMCIRWRQWGRKTVLNYGKFKGKAMTKGKLNDLIER